jgi:hypothetical protein
MSSIQSPVEKAKNASERNLKRWNCAEWPGSIHFLKLKSIPKAMNSASGLADPAVKVTHFKMSSIKSPVEKVIMPLSEILRDGIVLNDQGYPFPKKTAQKMALGLTPK